LERNHARSAFLTVFSPYSLRLARDEKKGTRKRGQATFSLRKRKSLLMDRTTEKVACPLFLRRTTEKVACPLFLRRTTEKVACPLFLRLFLRVCLSVVSYAAAEKSEWRMALKI